MNRIHGSEFHDLQWFPPMWRDFMTDVMSFFASTCKPYAVVAEKLGKAIMQAEASEIVDLCSGAGMPLLTVHHELCRSTGRPLKILLTDKFPHVEAFRRLTTASEGAICGIETPVDATNVPEELQGFRTLFSSFHHFDNDMARGILADAVEKHQGIGIFEYTEQNLFIWGLPILLTPVFVWLVTPFMRPFSWRRVVWTYLLPVIPFIGAWDGLVSCLRTYSPKELHDLTAGLGSSTYSWETGQIRSFGACRITYLIGVPKAARFLSAEEVPHGQSS